MNTDQEIEELEEQLTLLLDVARSARHVYEAWVNDTLTRQNGMMQLRKSLERAGF